MKKASNPALPRRRSAIVALLAGLGLPDCLLAAPQQPPRKAASGAAKKPPRNSTQKSVQRNVQNNAPRASAPTPAYAGREDMRFFAAEVSARRGLDRDWVEGQLAQARRQSAVEKLIMPPPAGTAKNWAAYRDRFVEPRRIAAGLAFWQAHEARLREAEARWGVPPEIVAAIIGVETFYGRHTGGFRVIDALATLTFDFPSGRKDRSAFFRAELEEFLVLCQHEGSDPQAARGSFAGAMGLPQFMPSSIGRHALDFDGDGHVDLLASPADAIGSVAHYLASFGWRRGLPTHYDVAVPVDPDDRALLLGPDIVPSFTPAMFAQHGAVLGEAGRLHDGLLALVMLENGEAAPTYIAGTSNFYVITRYNWSSYYALAVITLAEALRRGR